MFPLIETIKILNGIPQNLEWHQWRMDNSYYSLFSKQNNFSLSGIIRVPERYRKGIVKLRLLYGQKSFSAEYSSYSPKTLRSLKLVYDDDIDYSLKYTDRSKLNILLNKKGNCDDILIVKNGFLTDSSFTNIVFFDGDKWYTPSTPLLRGTARQKLICANVITEIPLTPQEIEIFTHFRLINSMLDFQTRDMIETCSIFR